MLAEDRTRRGWSVEQAARRLRVGPVTYREMEEGTRSPAWETWDRICEALGWPRPSTRGAAEEEEGRLPSPPGWHPGRRPR